MTVLPVPKNTWVDILNKVIDVLIKGLGEDAAYAVAVAEVPELASPWVSWIVKDVISYLGDSLDVVVKDNADIVLIRFQGDERKAEYDKAIEEYKKDPSKLQSAKDAIDQLIHPH